MSRKWIGKPHQCMIGKCKNDASHVWYNNNWQHGKVKICEACYAMFKKKSKWGSL